MNPQSKDSQYVMSYIMSMGPLLILGFIFFVIAQEIFNPNQGSGGQSATSNTPPIQTGPYTGGQATPTPLPGPTQQTNLIPGDQSVLAAPYKEYILTQGPHGFSYGHAAIDISGGKAAPISSPINGIVTDNYTDQYGNTTLIIDNDKFTVLFLHGNFSVKAGDKLNIGDLIGTEGNNGYTMDMAGRLCTNRDCGYHSHLNVYDKEQGQNINPLDYFELQPVSQLSRTVWN